MWIDCEFLNAMHYIGSQCLHTPHHTSQAITHQLMHHNNKLKRALGEQQAVSMRLAAKVSSGVKTLCACCCLHPEQIHPHMDILVLQLMPQLKGFCFFAFDVQIKDLDQQLAAKTKHSATLLSELEEHR